ncbi:MAG TPA: hypothetical protein VFW19_18685, partial [Allosphingosinicella sp.]|nr:hypothetical protein [Allosphingosinicella sp.]
RTIVPERAEASLSVRLAGGQRSEEIAPALEKLLRDALPAGAGLELRLHGAEPSRFDPETPALVAARAALERGKARLGLDQAKLGVEPAVDGGAHAARLAIAAR